MLDDQSAFLNILFVHKDTQEKGVDASPSIGFINIFN